LLKPNLNVVIPVFRDAKRAEDAARAMVRQVLPKGLSMQVILVDDGSGDGTTEYLNSLHLEGAEVLSLQSNLGRSRARNAGARFATGDVVVFMDCDCLPTDANWLASHFAAYEDATVVAATGGIVGLDESFWGRFQNKASERRRKQHSRGAVFSGSSQNLSVRKSAFDKVCGFDADYTEYGFEDRDLLLRLATEGKVSWIAEATVVHRDEVDMITISSKMRRAGGSSAERFGQRHSAAYRELGYAFFDARIHPFWRIIGTLLRRQIPYCARVLQKAISDDLLPFLVAAPLVRLVTGLSFAAGTLDTLATRADS
jgi:glycosyltransferase involved in cell wall biosynthesis